jgi:hypothetical protein
MDMRMKKTKKSPLKKQPLHYAGQSLDEAINNKLIDKIGWHASMVALLFAMVVLEWYRFYTNVPPRPVLVTIIVLPVIIYSLYRIYSERQNIYKLKQGRDGERAVGQYLEHFRESGAKVYHDIIGEGFNIDHILISIRGIHLIETKTYSKPIKGKTEIEFDGLDFYFNGVKYDNDIRIQVVAASAWLEGLVAELTAKKIKVRPVVLFPGWFVKMTHRYDSTIWALNPKNLQKFFANEKEILSKEEVRLISNHIARYIRS